MADSTELPFGEWLRQQRKALRVTQKALGEAVGVSRQAVNLWEAGTAQPTPQSRRDVERVFAQRSDRVSPVSESGESFPRVSAGLPRDVRVWLQRELLEYAEAGVSDEHLDTARQLFERPEVFTLFVGGRPTAATPEEAVRDLRAMARAVRDGLRGLGYNVAPDTDH